MFYFIFILFYFILFYFNYCFVKYYFILLLSAYILIFLFGKYSSSPFFKFVIANLEATKSQSTHQVMLKVRLKPNKFNLWPIAADCILLITATHLTTSLIPQIMSTFSARDHCLNFPCCKITCCNNNERATRHYAHSRHCTSLLLHFWL